jgi:pimeloyl-ACP methyl ester carboxylesterase
VFCHPSGDEKQKSYRAYVNFARSLAEAGIPSLRFDCFGYGDSEGDVVEASIESQVQDTHAAVDLLQKKAGIKQVVLIGVRLGAAVAVLAAKSDSRVTGLMLVAPVVDGAAYWDWLVRTQQMSFLTRGMKSKNKEAMLAELETIGHLEIAADRLSRSFVEQLRNIDLLRDGREFSGSCVVTAVAADDTGAAQATELSEAYKAAGVDVSDWTPEPRDFWTSQALYDGYTPMSLYTRTNTWISRLT